MCKCHHWHNKNFILTLDNFPKYNSFFSSWHWVLGLKVHTDSFNSYILLYLRLSANKNTLYWIYRSEDRCDLVWETTLINIIFHFHTLWLYHSHTNPLLSYCPWTLSEFSPRMSITPFPWRHFLAPPSVPVPPAQVHLTLLKSAEINYDLAGTDAHTSSIFIITNTPALPYLSRRYSAHVVNQILHRESWHSGLMALTQTCLIEFTLVTERLPTIRKKN